MNYIGIDLHKKAFNACVMDSTGKVLFEENYPTNLESLTGLVSSFPNSSVVLEATQNWMWMVRSPQTQHVSVT